MFKKGLSIMLVMIIIVSSMPMTVFANVENTKGNTIEDNQRILDALNAIDSENASEDEVLASLQNLGLLDSKGELVTSSINVDGVDMTLEEVRAMLSDPDVDLTQIVSIDGTSITLENLKKIIAIEDELARIRDAYLSPDITVTEEHQTALASFTEQLQSEGLTFNSGDTVVEDLSGVYRDVRVSLSVQSVTDTEATVVATLSKEQAEDVSFNYYTLDGSADTTYYNETIGSAIISAGDLQTTIDIPIIFSDTKEWEGKKNFYLVGYDIKNALFDNEKERMTIDIGIAGEINFSNMYRTSSAISLMDDAYINVDDWDILDSTHLEYNNGWSNNDDFTRLAQYNFDEDTMYLMNQGIINSLSGFEITYSGLDEAITDVDLILTMGIMDRHFSGQGYSKYEFKSEDIINFSSYMNTTDLRNFELKVVLDMEGWGANFTAGEELKFASNRSDQLRLMDSTTPTVASIEMDTADNDYVKGDQIPIVVTFSERVKSDGVTLKAQGITSDDNGQEQIATTQSLPAQEEPGTFSHKLSFLFPVDQPISKIKVTEIAGVNDLENNTANFTDLTETAVVKYISKKRDAFLGYNVNLDDKNGTIEIPIDTDNSTISSWVISEAQENNNAKIISSLSAKVMGENHNPYDVTFKIDDLANPTKLIGTFTAPMNDTSKNEEYIIAFYLDHEIGSSDNKELLFDVDKSYTIESVVYLEESDFAITYDVWPEALSQVYLDEISTLDLGISVSNPDATWQTNNDFLWESSNTDVATIDKDGGIVLTGKNGDVYFTLTALNGNTNEKQVTIQTDTINVKAGLTPYLIIPEGVNTIMATKGTSAQLRWSSNLVQKKIDDGVVTDTNFAINIYKAVYDGETITNGKLVHSDTVLSSQSNPVASYTIPAEVITDISVIGQVSYVVEISSEGLTATGYIQVKSLPAVVSLQPLDNLYMTDETDSVDIQYTVENFDNINPESEFLFKIVKNEEETPIIETTEMTGNYTLNLENVSDNNLKDIYTVTVMAKNALEPTWSYDSYVLYVYNDDALKITTDGEIAPDAITLDNNPAISGMSSQEILDLKREIYLGGNLSVNSDAYDWNQLGDMISWNAHGDSATINFNNFGTYFNIDALKYTGYSPMTDFILSGLEDGETDITAIHGLSRMSDNLDVTVKTLKDKLYILQVFPKAKTEVTYVNGNGEEKVVDTNDDGAIAIYEESSINGDLYLKSSFNGEVYLGTVYNNTLKTQEKDLSQKEMYPLNIAELRPVTKPSVILNTKDGKPFNGHVTLRGGVYKNGQYCENALINGQDGKTDQTVRVNNGVFEVPLDSTQFWVNENTEELKGTDQIEFIFEIQFPGGNYYPEIIHIEGNVSKDKVLQNGENKAILTDMSAGDGNSPYLYKSKVHFSNGSDIKVGDNISKVGPNQNFSDIELISSILLLGGEKGDGYSSEILDQFGEIPKGQSQSIMEYPFSSFPILTHKLQLNKDTLWMGDRLSRNISVKINKGDNQIAKLPYHFNIVNLLNVDITADGEITGFPNKMLSQIMKSDEEAFGTSDRIITAVLETTSDVEGLDTSVIQMMLKPTADPAVFDTIIKINVGYGNVGGIDDSKDTGVYVTGPNEDSGEFSAIGVDGALDTRDFFAGNYKSNFTGSGKTNKSASLSPSFQGGGYITGKIRYNFDNGKWEMFTTSSGFNVAAGINAQILINSMIGPVPVTAEFDASGSVSFAYAMASHSGTTIQRVYEREFINDYLKELRFDLYVKAFGGLGVDYSILAIKIGVFGDQDVSLTQRWLYRDYLSNKDQLFGRELRAEGRVGIEFKAKALFVEYKKILASAGYSAAKEYYSWEEIDNYWRSHKNGTIQDDPIGVIMANAMNNQGMQMDVAYQTVTLEERDYLENNKREWNRSKRSSPSLFSFGISSFGIMSVDSPNEVSSLETNSYPYSNPLFTDDGQLMVYLSDMDSSDVTDTKVSFSKRSGDSYTVGSELYKGRLGYGDSYLSVDGENDFAAATWVTQTVDINKDAGTELTSEDIALMNNSTEVMTSIYTDGSWSAPVALSDNAHADLAPVVATNGDKIVVAWRSTYAEDAEKPFEFGGNDKIVYKTYDNASKQWSEETVLYNGTIGNVMGLEAEMLSDGTSSVVYTVEKTVGAGDPNAAQDNNNLEVLYSVVDANGDIVQNVRATNDDYVDENPQITTHTFEDGKERFVIGWYSVTDDSDIRLCAFNNEGALYNGFIDSISQVLKSSDVTISSKFKFAKGDASDDVSIVWVESMKSDTNGDEDAVPADKDGLYGIKVLTKNGRFYATSPNELGVMNDYTLIDHFDARTDGDNIKAVILATDYNSGEEKEYTAEDGSKIYVQEGISQLLTATGVFDNSIRIDNTHYDIESLRPGIEIPVQFEVYNSGIDAIESLDITFDGVKKSFDLENPLLSGRSKSFTIYYTVPENIKNINYTITAYYPSASSVSESSKLYMVFPDVGISQMNIVGESQGLRDIAFSLYNASGVNIDDSKHKVLINFYDNPNLEGDALSKIEITSAGDIKKVNNGTYTSGTTFDLTGIVESGKEIPSGGITIYGYAEIKELDGDIHLPEINGTNNKKSVTFESLIEKQNKQQVSIITEQVNQDDTTTVKVTVKNNSFAKPSDGNLIVSLKDEKGKVIEQKQSYNQAKANNGLLDLGIEASKEQSFEFNALGASHEVVYSDAVLASDNADLGSLAIKGVPLYFEQNVYDYDLTVDQPQKITMNLMPANPKATIKVNGEILEGLSKDISLSYDVNEIGIDVVSEDGQVTNHYALHITVSHPNDNSSGSSRHSVKKNEPKDEDIIEMDIDANSSLSTSDFDQLRGNPDKALLLKGDFYSILFNGGKAFKDVQDEEINLGLSFDSPNANEIAKLAEDNDTVNLYFSYHGELPTPGEVTVDVGKDYKDKDLYLYYYNEATGKLENYGLIKGNSDGSITFTIDHCSNYVLSEDWIIEKNIYEKNIDRLSYISGYPNKNFGPDDYITRGETAKLLDNILANAEVTDKLSFSDINMWAKDSILQLNGLGYINGYDDGTFKPNNNITRAEFIKLITNILGTNQVQSYREVTFNDIANSWAKNEIEAGYKLGLINGYDNNKFKPNAYITRAEVVTILNKLIDRKINTENKANPFKDLTKQHWAYDQIISAIK